MPVRSARHRSRRHPRVAALLGAAGLAVVLGAASAPAVAATPTATATASPGTPTPVPPSSAPADVALAGEACPEGEGATVVVDPQGLTGGELDGPTAACAPEAADGLSALTEAGYAVTEVSPGFVCSIAGVPTPEQANCETDGYWAYFYAPRDGGWTASDVGAAERTPEPGGVEAWSWTTLSGDSLEGAAPRVDPSAVTDLPVAGAAATTSPTGGATPTTPAPSPSAGGGVDEDAGASTGADIAEDGPPVGTIAVAAVLAVLVVVGGLLAVRRRRADLDEHGRGGSDAR